MKTHHGRLTLQGCRDKALAHLREIEADIAADRAKDVAHYDTFDADDIREAEERGARWALDACAGEGLLVSTFYCGPGCPEHPDVAPDTYCDGAKGVTACIIALDPVRIVSEARGREG